MAKHAALTRYIDINGTAFSDHCRSIEITDEADNVEVTSFSGSGYKEYVSAFKDATIQCDIFADYGATSFGGSANLHAALQALYASGGTFTVTVREDSTTAVSATNPKATMTAKLYAYSPMQGAVGDAAVYTAALRNAGTAGLVWSNS
jgi:hypothetical protein